MGSRLPIEIGFYIDTKLNTRPEAERALAREAYERGADAVIHATYVSQSGLRRLSNGDLEPCVEVGACGYLLKQKR